MKFRASHPGRQSARAQFFQTGTSVEGGLANAHLPKWKPAGVLAVKNPIASGRVFDEGDGRKKTKCGPRLDVRPR